MAMHHSGFERSDNMVFSAVEHQVCTIQSVHIGMDDKSSSSKLMMYINEQIMGGNKHFSSPFGCRKYMYCDYTASGRALQFIEEYIMEHVLPDYGNTHTTTTVTSLQTTLFRHEARDIVRNCVNAGEHDAVLFTGSGCTGAIQKLIHAMDFKVAPVVFVSLHEHHSNLLPWRELSHKVVLIEETAEGLLNLKHLEHELRVWQSSGRPLIGTFIAASNVTGVLEDTVAVTELLHRYSALSFWDYATAAPYVKMNMNPVKTGVNAALTQKDAIFFSSHKFVGGVQTPGILIAKRELFKSSHPFDSGGGTVFFVSRTRHRYHEELELREEGGTPAIVESVRAGLVMQLKDAVGVEAIEEREHFIANYAFDAFSNCPNLVVLGPKKTVPRLPIFAILVRHPQSGYFLHHNFVCTLLNDMFGIQVRGGCMCAGPYSMELLGITEDVAYRYEKILEEDGRLDRVHLRRHAELSDMEIIKPGHTRLSLTYFMSNEEIDFIIQAIKMVAEHGWVMLPQYKFNPNSGEWTHHARNVFEDRKWLSWITYDSAGVHVKQPQSASKPREAPDFQACLQEGKKIFSEAGRVSSKMKLGDQAAIFDAESGQLRWFLLPSEAVEWANGQGVNPANVLPFQPTEYPKAHQIYTKSWSKCLCNSTVEGKTCSVHALLSTSQPPNPVPRWRSPVSSTSAVPAKIHNNPSMSRASSDKRPDFIEVFTQVYSRNFIDSQASIEQFDDNMSHNSAGMICNDELPGVSLNQQCFVKKNSPNNTIRVSVQNSSSGLDLTDARSCTGQTHSGRMSRTGSSNDNNSNSRELPPQASAQQAVTDTGDSAKAKAVRFHAPPKTILKPTLQALEDYNMIRDGDKVLVCLSGGKDSLSLLHTLRHYKFYANTKGIKFELAAVTVDPDTPSYDPSPLKEYLQQLDTPYFFEKQAILEAARNLPYPCASICSFCSRMKRGRLYETARREGYNVLAMGHHLDDLAESFLMSAFYSGLLHTMKASYVNKEEDLRIIRPFVYVREKELRNFAQKKNLPVIPENCPACFEAPKERHRMKQILAAQEVQHPQLFNSLMSALRPLMAINSVKVSLSGIVQTFLDSADINLLKPVHPDFYLDEEEDEN